MSREMEHETPGRGRLPGRGALPHPHDRVVHAGSSGEALLPQSNGMRPKADCNGHSSENAESIDFETEEQAPLSACPMFLHSTEMTDESRHG